MADNPAKGTKAKYVRTLKEDLSSVGEMIFGQGLAGNAARAMKSRPSAIDAAVDDVELARRHANQNTDSNNY